MKKIPFLKTILYEDNDYFVVNKPPMVSTLADRLAMDHMLLRAKKYFSTAQVCHRLDKGTSGVLVFAKPPAADQPLAQQCQERTVQKVYHAVVEGVHSLKDHLVEAAIAVGSKNRSMIDRREGKSAVTRFDTFACFERHTLLLCRPLTGKMHQIRLHASSQKAPLVGDIKYGGHVFYLSSLKKNYRFVKGKEELPLMERVALHALGIRFKGMKGETITVEAPYAKDFKALVRQLSFLSPSTEKFLLQEKAFFTNE